jgi:hypothetical protein
MWEVLNTKNSHHCSCRVNEGTWRHLPPFLSWFQYCTIYNFLCFNISIQHLCYQIIFPCFHPHEKVCTFKVTSFIHNYQCMTSVLTCKAAEICIFQISWFLIIHLYFSFHSRCCNGNAWTCRGGVWWGKPLDEICLPFHPGQVLDSGKDFLNF